MFIGSVMSHASLIELCSRSGWKARRPWEAQLIESAYQAKLHQLVELVLSRSVYTKLFYVYIGLNFDFICFNTPFKLRCSVFKMVCKRHLETKQTSSPHVMFAEARQMPMAFGRNPLLVPKQEAPKNLSRILS